MARPEKKKRFEYSLFGRSSQRITVGEWGTQAGKGRQQQQQQKMCITSSQLPLWATGDQSCWKSLGTHTSELILKGQGSWEYLPTDSHQALFEDCSWEH